MIDPDSGHDRLHPSPSARRSLHRTCGAICAAMILVGGWLVLRAGAGSEEAIPSVGQLRIWAEQGPGWAITGSLALMTLHSFLPAPAELIAIGNGIVFGPGLGILLTWVGAMIGAIIAFALARGIGRPAMHYLLSESRCAAIVAWEGRASQLLLVRLVPLISFNLINYAAGISGVGWWRFIWTTGVGILPMTVLTVMLGESLFEGAWTAVIVAASLLALLSIGLPHLRKRSAAPESQDRGRDR